MIDIALPPRPREIVPIVAEGPFAPACRPWRLRPPEDALVVIVKCTMAIVPGGVAEPLAAQEPPAGDVYFDDEPAASLRYASDFAPYKPLADVLLVGHAYPPSPRAAVVNVQLGFGRGLRVALAAIGDRAWRDGRPTDPTPFRSMPLRHERAFGGPGYAANPIGTGIIDGLPGVRLPNLEQPDSLVRSPGDRPAPACFAPVPPAWAARASRLGTYDADWQKDRWPYLPRDADYAYFNAAPPAQQIPYPRGDEDILLGGVHPDLRVIQGKLPGLVPRAFAQLDRARGYAFRPVPLHLDTVFIDADAMRVSLVWRGHLDVSAEHAPEVASLFVCEGRAGVEASAEAAQRRFFEITGAGAPAVMELAADLRGAGAKEAGGADRPAPAAPVLSREAVAALLASGASLAGENLAGCDLMSADLAGRDLKGAILRGAYLDGARLGGADLRGAVLAGASLRQADLRGADLRGANLAEASLLDADLSNAALDDASLPEIDAAGVRFTGASLARANLTDARLDRAVFDEANLTSADLAGAALTAASFRRATLDDAQIYGAAAEGCHFDDASLARFRADGAKLGRGQFARARAAESTFQAADLREASFVEADISGAVFNDANLERAALHRAVGRGARFRGARLVRVQALKVDLMEANFERADLSHADLRAANLYAVETLEAVLTGARLDQADVTGSKLAG